MKKIYIVSAKRTAIGSFNGSLAPLSAGAMGAKVIDAALFSDDTLKANISEVIMGNVLSAGQGQGPARQASINAGVPFTIPAYGVNMICGSGMKSIMNAYTEIAAGQACMVVAGGTESMSQAPFLLPYGVRAGHKMGTIKTLDHIIEDALTDAFDHVHMGVTAENIAAKYGITRQEQDEFAYASQQKAIAAIDAGKFKDEIVPLEVKMRKETITVDTDEYPNRKTNLEKLAKLRPAFIKENGTVTAGNASGINDGASALLIVNEDALNKYNLTPLVEIVSIGQAGCDPKVMGLGPIYASHAALDSAKLKLGDMDLYEFNEAFASQAIAVVKQLAKDYGMDEKAIMDKCNVNGGAIALGHPVGTSGARISVTLIHEMLRRKSTYGLASLCIGGGMGAAIVLKRV